MGDEVKLEKQLKLACVQAVITDQLGKKLLGEVLTLLDASVSDIESRKAVKSLVSQAFYRSSNRILLELNNLP